MPSVGLGESLGLGIGQARLPYDVGGVEGGTRGGWGRLMIWLSKGCDSCGRFILFYHEGICPCATPGWEEDE